MPNSLAVTKTSMTYPAPGGGTTVMPTLTLDASFLGQSSGFIDVPDGATINTEYSIPFGSVTVGATGIMVRNKTGQNVGIKFNAGTYDIAIADGAVLKIDMLDLPASLKLTAIHAKILAAQSGAGQIEYLVFGDPT